MSLKTPDIYDLSCSKQSVEQESVDITERNQELRTNKPKNQSSLLIHKQIPDHAFVPHAEFIAFIGQA